MQTMHKAAGCMKDAAPETRMAEAIVLRRKRDFGASPLIVAISGIDASGKSTLARRVVEELAARSLSAVVISVDDWHNPPEKRFSSVNPGEHFYQNAFRFDELFRILIQPLRRLRELQVTVGLTRMPHNASFRHTYDFRGVDVVIVEGIFLLKREWRGYFDLTFWVECSYQTALARALHRNQEALSGSDLLHEYQRIYFAAQRVHRAKDAPRENADLIIENDGMAPASSSSQAGAAGARLSAARTPAAVPSRLAGLGLRAREWELFDGWRLASSPAELECT